VLALTGRALGLAIGALSLALGLACVAGASRLDVLEQAIEAYTLALNTENRDARLEGFRAAERLFARVVERGTESPDLYTNLGNAALQAERPGHAILAYRRALRWHRTLSSSERAIAGALCFALAGVLAAAAIRLRQPMLRNLALLPGVVWLALTASLLLDPTAREGDQAVVTADEVVARAADSALAPSPFPAPLPGGAEVRILEERPPWVRIRLANGRDAWVAGSGISRVRRTASHPETAP
jgi:tetratricopeptide (TPR) repeat protein